jgi:hypothetical protein
VFFIWYSLLFAECPKKHSANHLTLGIEPIFGSDSCQLYPGVFNFGVAKISTTTKITEFREIQPNFHRIFFRDWHRDWHMKYAFLEKKIRSKQILAGFMTEHLLNGNNINNRKYESRVI